MRPEAFDLILTSPSHLGRQSNSMAALALLVVFAEVVTTAWSCMVHTQPPCATSVACQSSTWFVIDLASGARLCSNTYLPFACLGSTQGIRCENSADPTWLLPDGRSVANGGTDGFYDYEKKELLISSSFKFNPKFKGVYTCNQNEVLIHIGLYDTTAINNTGKFCQIFYMLKIIYMYLIRSDRSRACSSNQ